MTASPRPPRSRLDTDRGGIVLDTRTGATARLATVSRPWSNNALSGAGLVVFNLERGGGQVSIVPTARPPGLYC